VVLPAFIEVASTWAISLMPVAVRFLVHEFGPRISRIEDQRS
jgi:Flp pilus assembly protein TadB